MCGNTAYRAIEPLKITQGKFLHRDSPYLITLYLIS